MDHSLADRTSPEVSGRPVLLVPVGSLEQHGPHLPLDVDTVVATAVADGVAAAQPGTLVAPAVAFGSSGEHQSFAGTSSIGTEALTQVLVELTRSVAHWAGALTFVNGHGGNLDALAAATVLLRGQGHDVAWLPCAAPGADPHAGRTETSLMLHLRPTSVRLDRVEVGDTRPLRETLGLMTAGGVGAVSPNGVLGDPRGASAADGARLLAVMVEDALARLTARRPDARGMLVP